MIEPGDECWPGVQPAWREVEVEDFPFVVFCGGQKAVGLALTQRAYSGLQQCRSARRSAGCKHGRLPRKRSVGLEGDAQDRHQLPIVCETSGRVPAFLQVRLERRDISLREICCGLGLVVVACGHRKRAQRRVEPAAAELRQFGLWLALRLVLWRRGRSA